MALPGTDHSPASVRRDHHQESRVIARSVRRKSSGEFRVHSFRKNRKSGSRFQLAQGLQRIGARRYTHRRD